MSHFFEVGLEVEICLTIERPKEGEYISEKKKRFLKANDINTTQIDKIFLLSGKLQKCKYRMNFKIQVLNERTKSGVYDVNQILCHN